MRVPLFPNGRLRESLSRMCAGHHAFRRFDRLIRPQQLRILLEPFFVAQDAERVQADFRGVIWTAVILTVGDYMFTWIPRDCADGTKWLRGG